MNVKKLLAAYALVRSVNKYRMHRQHTSADKNEKCENYFRCDDNDNDGRGNY